jgi:phosphotransferase system IIB component
MFQLPKVQQDVIKKILDVKEVKSRWGTVQAIFGKVVQ